MNRLVRWLSQPVDVPMWGLVLNVAAALLAFGVIVLQGGRLW